MAIAARMPMIATTISSSISVKPFCFLLMKLSFECAHSASEIPMLRRRRTLKTKDLGACEKAVQARCDSPWRSTVSFFVTDFTVRSMRPMERPFLDHFSHVRVSVQKPVEANAFVRFVDRDRLKEVDGIGTEAVGDDSGSSEKSGVRSRGVKDLRSSRDLKSRARFLRHDLEQRGVFRGERNGAFQRRHCL